VAPGSHLLPAKQDHHDEGEDDSEPGADDPEGQGQGQVEALTETVRRGRPSHWKQWGCCQPQSRESAHLGHLSPGVATMNLRLTKKRGLARRGAILLYLGAPALQ